MEDGDWVMVRRPAGKDIWEPTYNSPSETTKPLKITFSGPAKFFTDAIPVGNGRLGCMVWGGVSSELLQLNEDTLWTGVPGNYTDPDAPKALSEVRNLVDKGDYVQATSAAVKLLGKPKNAYQPLGNIKLEFDDSHLAYAEETYYRELDLDTATASVKYSVGDVECTREHFASHPDQVIVTRISASKSGFLSFTVSLDSKLDYHSYVDGENRIVMEGSCPRERIIPPESKDNSEDPKGIQFSAVLHLQISGLMGLIHVLDDNTLKVEGADCAVLLLVGSSSFESPFIEPSDSKKDPTSECLHALKSITNFSYADLHAHHLEDYQDLFHRVSLHLWNGSNKSTGEGPLETKNPMPSKHNMKIKEGKDYVAPTAERIQSFLSDEDPSLLELLFQFGRYLLISCSRPGTQIANLQGIWNEDLDPKWQYVNAFFSFFCLPYLPFFLAHCMYSVLFPFSSNLIS
uniref:Uncharacterized protein n=1 Tax=Rhizophora mucronata TaxID=61149 RepID=A0A2P2KFW5_RHIMU